MKIFVKTNDLTSEKLNRDYTLCLISDIHNTKYSSFKLWNKLIVLVKEINPDYIIIAGDLIYQADDFLDSKTKDKLDFLLTNLMEIAPSIVVFGNHDLKDGKVLKQAATYSYFKELAASSNNRLILCDNDILTFDDISFIGVNPSYNNYYFTHENEWINIFEEALSATFQSHDLLETFNILITHSPLTLYKLENSSNDDLSSSIEYLKQIQLFLAGHIHDGLIPKWMQKIGLFKQSGLMFSEGNSLKDLTIRRIVCTRQMQNIFKGNMIVSGGITKWCQPNPLFGIVDKFLAKDIDVIKLKKK